MTDFSTQILRDYQVRKSRKQKTEFIRLLRTKIPELQVEESGMFHARNLLVGDLTRAKVIFSAHYDTCARMVVPNFVTPKRPLISILYSVLLVIPMVLFAVLCNALLYLLTDDFWIHYFFSIAMWVGMLLLLLIGPHNPHTVNDNTSGVITLYEIYAAMTPEQRKDVLFVFFDLEEAGLLGSAQFRKRHKAELKDKLLVNFDCVSDGDYILTAVSKDAKISYGQAIQSAFQDTEEKTILRETAGKVYYPSDQMGFPKHIAVASLKKSKIWGYYMDRIHTTKDTIFDERNISLLRDSAIRLTQLL